jgi:hypothetical protein
MRLHTIAQCSDRATRAALHRVGVQAVHPPAARTADSVRSVRCAYFVFCLFVCLFALISTLCARFEFVRHHHLCDRGRCRSERCRSPKGQRLRRTTAKGRFLGIRMRLARCVFVVDCSPHCTFVNIDSLSQCAARNARRDSR